MMKSFSALLLSVSLTLPAFAGFSLGQTRVIYDEKDKQATLQLINSGQDEHYLVQAWIESRDNKKSQDFMITPPVFKFYPKTQNTLLIKAISDNSPSDRESLYFINVKAIPATDSSIKNKVSFATKSIIKLIYRPNSLNATDAINARYKLKIQKKEGHIVVTNPTPYIVNIGYFYVNGKTEDVGYLLPFSEQKIQKSSSGKKDVIKFNAINDYGGASDFLTVNI